MIAVTARTALAEVFREFALGPVEFIVASEGGQSLGPERRLEVQGQPLRINRWSLPVNLPRAVTLIEKNLYAAMSAPLDHRRIDALQSVSDHQAVFAVLHEDPGQSASTEHSGPRFSRTILLRAFGDRTELTLTDQIEAAPSVRRFAARSNAMSWSLDGVPPAWTATEYGDSFDRQSIMFVSSGRFETIAESRRLQLAQNGFVVLDTTNTLEGTLVVAGKHNEMVSLFSFVDDDGLFVEIINHKFSSIQRRFENR